MDATRAFNETISTELRRAGDAMTAARLAILEHAEACRVFDWPMAEAAALAASAYMDVYFDALQAGHKALQEARRGPEQA